MTILAIAAASSFDVFWVVLNVMLGYIFSGRVQAIAQELTHVGPVFLFDECVVVFSIWT
jgi:hypothetical protein